MKNIIALPKKQYNKVYNYLWLLSSAPMPITDKTKNKLLNKIISILVSHDYDKTTMLTKLYMPTIDISKQKIMCYRVWCHDGDNIHQSVHIIQKQRD